MTLRQFAEILDGREYGCEITPEEEKLAKELGFVVVFGYSDDNAEMRGAIDDEIGCFDGGVLEHKDLQGTILAEWCPEDIDCSWHFSSTQPSEKFSIFEGEELYCVGIVIDNNKPKPKTNADRIRAMSDDDIVAWARVQIGCGFDSFPCGVVCDGKCETYTSEECEAKIKKWLQQPAEVE